MDNGRLWILLAKKKCGEATASELSELESLLMDKNLQGYSNEVLDKLWEKPFTSLPKMNVSDNTWKHIQRKINHFPGEIAAINNVTKKWIAAAAIILIAGVSFFIFKNKRRCFYQGRAEATLFYDWVDPGLLGVRSFTNAQ